MSFLVTCYTLTVVKLKEKIPYMYIQKLTVQMNHLTVFAILSPVAKQVLHFRRAKPTPSLNPAKKLLAGVSPQIHATAP